MAIVCCRSCTGEGARPTYFYFSVNIAFTWAVTEVVWGLNSSVGAVAVCAIALILAIGMGIGRTFSKVSTDAYESSPKVRPPARATASADARARR